MAELLTWFCIEKATKKFEFVGVGKKKDKEKKVIKQNKKSEELR